MPKTTIAVLGIDLGKNSCSLAGLDQSGAVVLRRRATREGVLKLIATLPPCVVAMEACCGAHVVGRAAAGHGHEVRLMPPKYVKPYVKAHKTDERDAEAIAEAATRPTIGPLARSPGGMSTKSTGASCRSRARLSSTCRRCIGRGSGSWQRVPASSTSCAPCSSSEA